MVVLRPQPGFQERFCASRADLTFGGGSAGCGKTYAQILDGARHISVPGFNGVFFRKTVPEFMMPNGLWDESMKTYPLLGAKPNLQLHSWTWPSTAKVRMAHMDGMADAYGWRGSAVPLQLWDELPNMDDAAFWFMFSRNRSTCGVRPYTKATMNPDAESWVAPLVDWYIEQDNGKETYGLCLPERAGAIRYFTRRSDGEIVWGDSRSEVHKLVPEVPEHLVKTFTYIPGLLSDNKILETADPTYRGNLLILNRVEKARLLYGNWKIRAQAGDYFRKSEVTMLDHVPTDVTKWIRRWDLAATEPSEQNPDPDFTFGVKMGLRENGRIVIADAIGVQKRSDDVRALIKRTAIADTRKVKIGIPKDPGQAGKEQAQSYAKWLAGFVVLIDVETGDKKTRARLLSSQWQHGNVDVVRGPWNDLYFRQMEGFPTKGIHDDAVDASTGAYSQVSKSTTFYDLV